MRVPGSLGARGREGHLHSGRSWFLKQNCLQGPRRTCYGRGTHRPHPSASGAGAGSPVQPRSRESHTVGLPGAQSSSSSSSFAGAAGGLSWTRKHSAKKVTMARYRCCRRRSLWK